MINQQLVDYVKQQMQAGVSKDVVRKALSDAGWPAADVDDSMKSVEPAAMTGGPAMSSSAASTQPSINPMVAMGGVSGNPSSEKFFAKPMTKAEILKEEDDEDVHPSTKKFMVATISMGTVIVLLAGALAFVYFNLNSQLSAAKSGSSGASGEVSTLQSQVTQLTTEKTDLTAQVSTLTSQNADLNSELAFFASTAPTGTSTVPAATATVKGLLTGNGSQPYVLTTAHNVRVFVANYKDAKVAAALAPLANGTSTVTLVGTHLPASTNLTVTSVNGAAL